MSWLLKIVEGPMKGAEIALVSGTRVKVGRGDACDIVIVDATLAEEAFELDVSDEAVTLLAPGGETRALKPFEVRDFGTTAIAVGPAEGEWQELVRPPKEEEKPVEEEKPAEPSEAVEEEKPAEPEPTPEAESTAAVVEEEKRSHGGLLWLIVLLVLLVLLGLAAWWFWPQVRERWTAWTGKQDQTVERPDPKAIAHASLADLAKEHGLTLSETNGVPLLVGNLKKRTERLAIRALALAADRQTQFDLSDDETLRSSAEALLFTITEGALKVLTATNRVIEIGGYAPGTAALERALRALGADLPGLAKLEAPKVELGGAVPQGLEKSAFARDELPPGVEQPPAAPIAAPAVAAVPAVADEAVRRKTANKRDFPVAGILTMPYPCVVLRDGSRCVEGAQIGGAVLEKIESDRLTFKEGKRTFTWEP